MPLLISITARFAANASRPKSSDMNTGEKIACCNSCYFNIRYNNNALAELNDCIGGLLNLGLIAYYI